MIWEDRSDGDFVRVSVAVYRRASTLQLHAQYLWVLLDFYWEFSHVIFLLTRREDDLNNLETT